jgi:hypothetical protein
VKGWRGYTTSLWFVRSIRSTPIGKIALRASVKLTEAGNAENQIAGGGSVCNTVQRLD